jgi:O-methyltransferase
LQDFNKLNKHFNYKVVINNMKINSSNLVYYLFNQIVAIIGVLFGRVLNILKHNGVKILDYPDKNWSLVPFPSQKGQVFNADNLATVNRHAFIKSPKFLAAKHAAESRWGGNARDISWRLNIILWASGRALKIVNEEAVFVECGTGKGYMAAAIAQYHNFRSDSPNFYLIDNFSADLITPEGVAISSPASFAYSDNVKEVKEYFKSYPSIKVVKGSIPRVLNLIPEKPIAFLHVDLNNAKAEYAALRKLQSRLMPGAIIVFDDYGGFGGSDQALVHEKFANENRKDLLTLPTGQAVIVW